MARAKAVAVVGVFDPKGRMLWGKRRDNGRWTTPAGHLEGGERPHAGACRELYEESGLSPDEPLRHVSSAKGGPNDELDIHTFTTVASGTPTTENDPDAEIVTWKWVDVKNGLPDDIAKNLHVPKDKNHLLLKVKPLRHVASPDTAALRGLSRVA